MKAERWNRIQEIFDAATEVPREKRETFVRRSAAGDDELASDVLAMLRADDSAGNFIETAVRGATTDFAAAQDPTKDLKHFGKYEILGWIGEGGFSQVHKGRDPMLQREVAIKTCTSASRDLRKRFYREAKISAGLQHPNIVTVHDLGVENGVPFLVQEFLSGDDLATWLSNGRRINPAKAVDQLIQVARGLEYAHRKGVLHRDIKPSNIQALNSGRVKILDFGIARFLEEDNPLTDQGAPIGTAGYQSPEQLEGLELDRRTDIFSFGVLAYELIASTRPFPGRSFAEVYHRVLHSRPKSLRKIVRDCPASLEALIMRCLENDREQRPSNFTEVIASLEEVAQALPPPTNPGAHLATHEITRGRRWGVVAAGLGLIVTGALTTFVILRAGAERSTADSRNATAVELPSKDQLPIRRGGGSGPGPGALGSDEIRAPEADPGGSNPTGSGPRPSAPVETNGPASEPPTEGVNPRPRSEGSAPPTASAPADSGADREVEPVVAGGSPVAADSTSGPTGGRTAPTSEPVAAEPVVQVDRSIWEETRPPVVDSPHDEGSVESELSVADVSMPGAGTGAQADRTASGSESDALDSGTSTAIDPAAEPSTAGDTVAPPELLEQLDPRFPTKKLRPFERTGLKQLDRVKIVLYVLVDENGRVTQTSVRSSNDPGESFEESAIEAVKGARFRPGTENGVPVAAWKVIVVEYPLP